MSSTHLPVHHLVDGLTLHVEVDQLLPGHLGVKHIPDLVPGDGAGDGAQENLQEMVQKMEQEIKQEY